MRFEQNDPPRVFEIGRVESIQIKDCGRIQLDADEQVTFTTPSGAEYDVARKSWGFYATPSLNGRLPSFGLRAVLIKSPSSKYYVFLVEAGKEADCQRYMDLEGHTVVCWLDNDHELERLVDKITSQ